MARWKASAVGVDRMHVNAELDGKRHAAIGKQLNVEGCEDAGLDQLEQRVPVGELIKELELRAEEAALR